MFIGLTETWLSDHCEAELQIDGYSLYRSDRKNKRRSKYGRDSGGAAVYMKEEMAASFELVLEYSDGTIEMLCLYSEREKLFIGVVYRPPNNPIRKSTSNMFQNALLALNCSINTVSNDSTVPDIIIGGDFNLPHANWKKNIINPGVSTEELVMIKMLEEFGNDHFLIQHVEFPTHRDGNTLDLILTNNDCLIQSIYGTKPLQSISHHEIINVSTQYKFKGANKKVKGGNVVSYLSPFNDLNFHEENIDWNFIKNKFEVVNWDNEFYNLGPQEILDKLYKLCYHIVKEHIPKRIKKHNQNSSKIPRDRRNLMRRRSRINKTLLYVCSNERIEKLKSELVKIEVAIQKSLSKYALTQESKAINSIKRNPKYFFSYVKKFSKVKSKIGPLLKEDNEHTADPKEMADLLGKQYRKVFSKPSEIPINPGILFADNKVWNLKDIQFSVEDIIREINNTPTSSSSGPDGLPIILLQKCPSLALPLHIFWFKCWNEEVTVQSLKEPIIIPIHKGGSKEVPANYRPISLTSHVVKIFEKIIRRRIVEYVETNGLFNPTQHGFRLGRSCLSQLLQQYDRILSYLEEGANVDVVYIDFAKAFDKVDFNTLLFKIAKLGIGGKLGRWLHSFLTNRTQRVLVNGVLSDSSNVLSGVPQGSVLGPLLFLILISDIDEGLFISILSSFADDTRLIAAVTNVLQASGLQTDLESVYEWAKENKMEFNDTKFEVLRLWLYDDSLKHCTNYTSSTGSIIPEKEFVKDLGVLMSNDGNFTEHINKVVTTVKKIVAWILRTFVCRSSEVMLTLWKTLVLPHIEYASQLWSPSQKGLVQKLEVLQWSFLRKIKSNGKYDYWELLKRYRLYSLERRRERYRAIYIWKILEGMVPNFETNGEIVSHTNNKRLGRMSAMRINILNSQPKVRMLRDSSFSCNSVKTFNALPKYIRDTTKCTTEAFKTQLDNFLKRIPDEPQIIGMTQYRRAESNSIMDMAGLQVAGGSPTSTNV